MEYKHLGKSGLKVSNVGLGCMNFHTMNTEAESACIVNTALDKHFLINFVNTLDSLYKY